MILTRILPLLLATRVATQNTLFNSCTVQTLAGIVGIDPPDAGAQANLPGAIVDGPNTTAQFFNPEDAAYDPISGNIYVADFLNQRVRVLAPVTFTVSTISHVFGSNPFNDEVWFDGPLALVVAPIRNIFVATNRSISQIVAVGATPVVVALPTLTNAFRQIEGMTYDGTTFTLYVSDILAQAIYSVNLQSTTPRPVLLAGIPSSPVPNGQRNAFDGAAPTARFAGPAGIAFDPFNRLLFVADFSANAIRTVALSPPFTVTTIAGNISLSIQGTNPAQTTSSNFDGIGAQANFSAPGYVAIAGPGQVIVSDTLNFAIRFVSLVGPTLTLTGVAGQGGPINEGYQDGIGSQVRFDSLAGMKPVWGNFPAGEGTFNLPSAFNTWVLADSNNNNIRLLTCSAFPAPATLTPTPSVTPTPSITPSLSSTPSLSPTVTPTTIPTPTLTPSLTPTFNPNPPSGAATGSSATPPSTLGLLIGIPLATTLVGIAIGVTVFYLYCNKAGASAAAAAAGSKGGGVQLTPMMAGSGGDSVVPNPLAANVSIIPDPHSSSSTASYNDLPGTPTAAGPSTSASSIQDWGKQV